MCVLELRKWQVTENKQQSRKTCAVPTIWNSYLSRSYFFDIHFFRLSLFQFLETVSYIHANIVIRTYDCFSRFSYDSRQTHTHKKVKHINNWSERMNTWSFLCLMRHQIHLLWFFFPSSFVLSAKQFIQNGHCWYLIHSLCLCNILVHWGRERKRENLLKSACNGFESFIPTFQPLGRIELLFTSAQFVAACCVWKLLICIIWCSSGKQMRSIFKIYSQRMNWNNISDGKCINETDIHFNHSMSTIYIHTQRETRINFAFAFDSSENWSVA